MKIFHSLAQGLLWSLCLSASVWATQWHMPTPYNEASLPTQIAHQFAQDIQDQTGGKLQIKIHSGASLMKHAEIPRAVRSGQVALGEVFIGMMGNVDPIFKHDNIPFLATSYAQAKKLWLAAKPEMQKQLNREGLMLLYTVPWPAQSLYTQKSIHSLADLKGLRMRAYSPSTSRLAVLMGSTPTTVQVPDIPQAFSTGIINAMVTSPSTGANSQAWDYVHYYTDIKAWIPKNMVIVNRRAFRRLDQSTQAIIMKAAQTAEEHAWQAVQTIEKQDIEALKQHGMIISQPSPALLKSLKEIGTKMVQEWQAESPEEITPVLQAYQKQ